MSEESNDAVVTADTTGGTPTLGDSKINQLRRIQVLMLALVLASGFLLILPTLTSSSLFIDNSSLVEVSSLPIPRKLVEFERQPGVVIVTKIHGLYSLEHQLQQSLCLLKHAYNHQVNYDIVVFTTEPILDFGVEILRSVVAPANLTVVWDNPGLRPMVSTLPKEQRHALLERCGLKSIRELTWKAKCRDNIMDAAGTKRTETNSSSTGGGTSLAYNWQAEFRALHIWNHSALAPYRYMLWLDSDAFCTQPWKRDPVVMAMQNQLTLLFDHFPQGHSQGPDFDDKFRHVFQGQSICHIKMTNEGTLEAKVNKKCSNRRIGHVHGFFHVTDMDFYRSPEVQRWLSTLIDSKYTFRRRYDDQIAVTVPASVWAPSKTWEMEAHGFRPEVYHNKDMDGRPDRRATHKGGFTGTFLQNNLTKTFPTAIANCTLNAYG